MVTPIKDQTLLILGSSGYIGQHLLQAKLPGVKFLQVHHKNFAQVDIQKSQISAVINLSSSPISANQRESFEANFSYQESVLRSLSKFDLKWIQISSYYEFQIPYGRSDYYSSHKAQFREFLSEFVGKNQNIRATSVVLPHIFGKLEPIHRLIPSIRRLNSGEKVTFGSRSQQIPILHIDDATDAIFSSISSPQVTCVASPIWYGKLVDLVKETSSDTENLNQAEFVDDGHTYWYKKVLFPDPLLNFKPKIDFMEFQINMKKGQLF
jgi:nucleoside-diphosphate-sugar epimerase